MGKIKHLTKIKEYLKKTPVFSLKSLQKIIGKKGNYVYLLVKNLVGKGEINRIVPGFYSLYDDPILTVFCFKPAYLGLQEALSVHNLWEQETNVLILTSRKVRPGVREVFGNNVLIRKINPRYFFGFEYKRYGDFHVPVSDIEKTFIDLIYYNQPIDKEVLKNFRKRIDLGKLNDYLTVYPKKIVKKVEKKLES